MPYLFDHRQLADEMEIFVLDEQVGAGLPIWLPNGVAIRDELEKFIKDCENQAGYHRVVSPHIGKALLYESSGHLRAFKENMYPPMRWPDDANEYYLKPMNCPHHHKVFAASPKSFRQLPYRIAEYGQVYRYENSGSLHGLSRVRGLCQNDAHIYIDPAQAAEEIARVLELHEYCYHVLQLKDFRYRLSKRDPQKPEIFEGADELWDESENILRQALQKKNLPFFEAQGEAAFYGPKIDVQMRLGQSEESIASIQLDFLSGERFDLSFVSSSGKSIRPWVVHRAPLGSHERFIAMLLEYYDGQLPGWLSPIQLYVIPVADEQLNECQQIVQELKQAGIRAQVDINQGSLSKRILFAHKYRPFAKMVVGSKEISSGKLNLQLRDREAPLKREDLVSVLQDLLKS